MTKTALVLGGGGFIGSHMVRRLKAEGYWVRAVDLVYPGYSPTEAHDFLLLDLRDRRSVGKALSFARCRLSAYNNYAIKFDETFDEIYQFAADMGGAGYIFTGDHDADVMHNSATINLNVLDEVRLRQMGGNDRRFSSIFYSSSACIYPHYNQVDPDNPKCGESTAYPASPDSEYGWEKLFSERLYLAYGRNYSVPIRLARFHNIYGPEGTYDGGKEKAPAAVCRKVSHLQGHDGRLEIWGDGKQTRSFLYIDDCIDGVRKLMAAAPDPIEFCGPVNIGSEEMVSIQRLYEIALGIAGKTATFHYDDTRPQGVRGRNSDNALIESWLGWKPKWTLEDGMKETYTWINQQIYKGFPKAVAVAHTGD